MVRIKRCSILLQCIRQQNVNNFQNQSDEREAMKMAGIAVCPSQDVESIHECKHLQG